MEYHLKSSAWEGHMDNKAHTGWVANEAIEEGRVDLYGRIGLFTGKGNVASGPAEVMDFLTGTELSEGGRSIFALTSRDSS